ncbi:PTS sugar transporter subunit IIA [Branchiibius cervicis]|uniref:Ascorbate-specific PTS system EIIA component n=1 Tax=Branchiibius cervicis TaxID=908252 RepID=A0ABW2AYA9_9MICO
MDIDQALPDAAFDLDAEADTWQDALRLAGAALSAAGFTTPAYAEEMIKTVEELGPYIVIAPGIALGHSRPSPAVLSTGMSLVRLKEPVPFGHPKNDPVWLVIGLAATDENSHIDVMAALASALGRPDSLQLLREAKTPEEIRTVLRTS